MKFIVGKNGTLPRRATKGSAGYDLYAAEPMLLYPRERKTVGTDISVELAPHTEGQVRSRSGLAARSGIVVLNSPGTIDSDYTGEIRLIMYNVSAYPYMIQKGDRIAQLVIAPVIVGLDEPTQDRGDRGLGSSGQ